MLNELHSHSNFNSERLSLLIKRTNLNGNSNLDIVIPATEIEIEGVMSMCMVQGETGIFS